MRKRGKQFRRRLDPRAGLRTIAMQQQMADDQLRDLGMEIHVGVERMRLGIGQEQDFHNFAAMVNVTMVFCERGLGEEYGYIVEDAKVALLRVIERSEKTGRWAFDGSGMTAINACTELFEKQMNGLTRDGAQSAIQEVYRRQAHVGARWKQDRAPRNLTQR